MACVRSGRSKVREPAVCPLCLTGPVSPVDRTSDAVVKPWLGWMAYKCGRDRRLRTEGGDRPATASGGYGRLGGSWAHRPCRVGRLGSHLDRIGLVWVPAVSFLCGVLLLRA